MTHSVLLKLALTLTATLPLIRPALAGEAEAVAIDANIQARHLPFQTIADPVFASPSSNQITGYTRCGDSALWTGHYLAAESYRYRVTQDPAALAAVKSAIAGIRFLVDATGRDILARCAFPENSPFAAGIENEESHNGVFYNPGMNVEWIGNTSRDQYSGVFFGLAAAYDLVDDADVRGSVSVLVTRMVDALTSSGWNLLFIGPFPSFDFHATTWDLRDDQKLTLLQIARHVNSAHFGSVYAQQSAVSLAAVGAPIAFDTGSDSSYFKFNLDSINLFSLIRLDNGSEDSAYRAAYGVLRVHTAPQQNAFFNMIDRGVNGPDPVRDQQTLQMLDLWLTRPRRDNYVDLHGAVPVCGDQACDPVPVNLRPPTDFLWQRSPYQLAGGGQGLVEGAGIDYLLPYWMARYYGITGPFAVQSAAGQVPVLAPDSLGAIYGTNLAPFSAQATGNPLPQSLAGVTLTLTDAAKVGWPVSLLYVSPGQINFLTPGGAAAGMASLTVAGNGAPQTANVSIAAVAPALFSANGTGTGVAAATAIRVDNAGQTELPVFDCQGHFCSGTPLPVAGGGPVYVTLYATGVRNRGSLNDVQVTVNGTLVPVTYAGIQPVFAGLDQVNILLPESLKGSGEVGVILRAGGQNSNPVTLTIQ